jgi:hypothetical protein
MIVKDIQAKNTTLVELCINNYATHDRATHDRALWHDLFGSNINYYS